MKESEANDNQTIKQDAYWKANIRVLSTLLAIWAFVTFGCGILMGPWLDQFYLGGFPLGFWFTQQGAMLVYVVLIFVYHIWMRRIERAYGLDEDSSPAARGE
jgi:putative solute:sodium symporter small subunit